MSRKLTAALAASALIGFATTASPVLAQDATLMPGQAAETTTMQQTQQETAEMAENAETEVVATVDGENITQQEVQRGLAPYQQQLAQMPPEQAAMAMGQVRQQVMNQLIMEKAILAQAKQSDVTVSDEQIDEQVFDIVNQIGGRENLDTALAEMGMNEESFRAQVRENLLINEFVEQKQDSFEDPSQEEIASYYEENKDQFSQPETVEAKHILISTQEAAGEEEVAQAKQKAEDLRQRIEEGAEFEKLARENSDCPSSQRGGDLGEFQRGQMVKPFEDTAFSMAAGNVSDVVETQFGYHIIKVEDHQQAKTPSLEEVDDQVVAQLKGEQLNNWLENLRQEANVEMKNADGQQGGMEMPQMQAPPQQGNPTTGGMQ